MDDTLLQFLVCPITKSKLRREGDFLLSEKGGYRYPIKDGLPVLLPTAAVKVGETAQPQAASQQAG